jgi:hypothetical protein
MNPVSQAFLEQLLDVWRMAPVVIVLVLALWAGRKGWWYFDAGVKRLVEQLERERDVWRSLAFVLLQKEGIQLPESFTMMGNDPPVIKSARRAEDRPDPWKPT